MNNYELLCVAFNHIEKEYVYIIRENDYIIINSTIVDFKSPLYDVISYLLRDGVEVYYITSNLKEDIIIELENWDLYEKNIINEKLKEVI